MTTIGVTIENARTSPVQCVDCDSLSPENQNWLDSIVSGRIFDMGPRHIQTEIKYERVRFNYDLPGP